MVHDRIRIGESVYTIHNFRNGLLYIEQSTGSGRRTRDKKSDMNDVVILLALYHLR